MSNYVPNSYLIVTNWCRILQPSTVATESDPFIIDDLPIKHMKKGWFSMAAFQRVTPQLILGILAATGTVGNHPLK